MGLLPWPFPRWQREGLPTQLKVSFILGNMDKILYYFWRR